MTIAAAIFGASGYAGAELLRLLGGHPSIKPCALFAHSRAGVALAEDSPQFDGADNGAALESFEGDLKGAELVFLALPHGESQKITPELAQKGVKIVDLGADFRFSDAGTYENWYGKPHDAPAFLSRFVYGLPEKNAEIIAKSDLVAAPGCYPTAAILSLMPLVQAGLVDANRIVVNAASGVSGAGRAANAANMFCEIDGSMRAYGLVNHRHTGEIEALLGAQVLFTPSLAPMSRGILSVATAPATSKAAATDALECLEAAYAGAPFVTVSERSPATKWTLGTNRTHLTERYDARTGSILAISALDNLVKGAAGQAIQCANLMFGLDETAGLEMTGVTP